MRSHRNKKYQTLREYPKEKKKRRQTLQLILTLKKNNVNVLEDKGKYTAMKHADDLLEEKIP